MAKAKEKNWTVVERVLNALKKNGAMSLDELAKRIGTGKATLYSYLGALQKKHGVVKVSRGVYALKGNAVEPATPRAASIKSAPKSVTAAHFAIDESGAIGIEKEAGKLRLDPEEVARMRVFIDKTEGLRGDR